MFTLERALQPNAIALGVPVARLVSSVGIAMVRTPRARVVKW